jgi:hypothetical protein
MVLLKVTWNVDTVYLKVMIHYPSMTSFGTLLNTKSIIVVNCHYRLGYWGVMDWMFERICR